MNKQQLIEWFFAEFDEADYFDPDIAEKVATYLIEDEELGDIGAEMLGPIARFTYGFAHKMYDELIMRVEVVEMQLQTTGEAVVELAANVIREGE